MHGQQNIKIRYPSKHI